MSMAKSKALNDAVDRIRTVIEEEREALGLGPGKVSFFTSPDGRRVVGTAREYGSIMAEIAYAPPEASVMQRGFLLERMPEREDEPARREANHKGSRTKA